MSETVDQARTRRRWVTLAELVAVAGVVIAALSLWLSWSERRDDRVEHQRTEQQEARKDRIVLRGAPSANRGTLKLKSDTDHAVGTAHITFPTSLGVPAQDTVSDEIERDWIARPLLKMTDGGADEQTGRLPVLIAFDYSDPDGLHHAHGIYELVWKTRGRRLLGRQLDLTGFRLLRSGGTAAELDRLWVKPKP